jgi:hypothetical protein
LERFSDLAVRQQSSPRVRWRMAGHETISANVPQVAKTLATKDKSPFQ